MRGARLAAIAAAGLLLAGCSGSGAPPAGVAGVGAPGLTPGTRIEVFTCADWNRADLQTQIQTVASIRDFIGGQVTGAGASGSGTVLDDERAYDFFDQYCEQELARHFLLYKLYGRAAGFAGQAP
jgi:hypothetical protein